MYSVIILNLSMDFFALKLSLCTLLNYFAGCFDPKPSIGIQIVIWLNQSPLFFVIWLLAKQLYK